MARKSFSLIELMIVLAILAGVTVVAVNRFGSINPDDMRLKLNNSLEGIFAKARLKAELENREVVLVFESNEEEIVEAYYFREDFSGGDDESEKEGIHEPELQAWIGDSSFELPIFCSMSDEEPVKFYFYPDGEAAGDELLIEAQGFKYRVNVDLLTSRLILDEE